MKAFGDLVDAYETFVRDADQYRLSQSHTPGQLEQLTKDHDLVKQRADEARRAVEQET